MLGTKILEERKSKYNGDLRVVRTWGMGTYITSQGLTQSGGIVEDIWKSTLRKIKNQKSKIKKCLILGLGGGTVAKLIRKSYPNAKITGIDIDPVMVELGKKYLDFDDQNVEIIIADAMQFVTVHSSRSTVRYDLVIVDLYNGDKFPTKFETENYIQLIRSLLSSRGIVIFNRLYYGSRHSHKEKKIETEKFGEKLKKVFKNVESFRPVSNIMYICSN